MIVNAPTSENLDKLALRLYFGAWSDLLLMEFQFDEVYDPDSQFDWTDERTEYLEYCQPELQAIYTTIQQSNELALKARICAVSPYLLLLNSSPPLSTKGKDIDFATLRTLDATDLPGAVNSLSGSKLSEKFIQSFHQIRSYRNQIAHLGATNRKFSPKELLHLLVFQYRELWPNRRWLQDRVKFAAETTTAFFHDGRYGTAHAVAVEELPNTFNVLTATEFKALFNYPKSARRYYCHSCVYEGSTKYIDARDYDCKTAFLSPDGKTLECIMCGITTSVVRIKCSVKRCKGDVIAKEGEHEGVCHVCGESPSSD